NTETKPLTRLPVTRSGRPSPFMSTTEGCEGSPPSETVLKTGRKVPSPPPRYTPMAPSLARGRRKSASEPLFSSWDLARVTIRSAWPSPFTSEAVTAIGGPPDGVRVGRVNWLVVGRQPQSRAAIPIPSRMNTSALNGERYHGPSNYWQVCPQMDA